MCCRFKELTVRKMLYIFIFNYGKQSQDLLKGRLNIITLNCATSSDTKSLEAVLLSLRRSSQTPSGKSKSILHDLSMSSWETEAESMEPTKDMKNKTGSNVRFEITKRCKYYYISQNFQRPIILPFLHDLLILLIYGSTL